MQILFWSIYIVANPFIGAFTSLQILLLEHLHRCKSFYWSIYIVANPFIGAFTSLQILE